MNERIGELAFKAVSECESDMRIPPEFYKKFAELIVWECLFIIDDESKPEMVSRIELWKQIKEHFGVEE